MRRLGLALGALIALLGAAPAHAVPDCAGSEPVRTVLDGQGVLESVIADERGIFYTDSSRGALMLLSAPGAAPRAVAAIPKPGGLLLEPDGSLLVGSGNGFVEGAIGNVAGQAKLLRVQPETGSVTTYAEGLAMANGLARDPSGAIFASDDAGVGIDRIVDGVVQPRWATVVSSNGLAVDGAGEFLFAVQTFQPPAVVRIDLDDPARQETFVRGAAEDLIAGLDGMTIDHLDRLFFTANGGGEVWRAGPDRSACAMARGLLLPSAVAFGGGGAFPPTSLFVVTFSGVIGEIPGARPQPESLPGSRSGQAGDRWPRSRNDRRRHRARSPRRQRQHRSLWRCGMRRLAPYCSRPSS